MPSAKEFAEGTNTGTRQKPYLTSAMSKALGENNTLEKIRRGTRQTAYLLSAAL